jgi:hypothetical protein
VITTATLVQPAIASFTVATLPGGLTAGTLAYVTDGSAPSDCTIGGGSNKVLCAYNGTAWAFPGGGSSGGTSGGVDVTWLPAGPYTIAFGQNASNGPWVYTGATFVKLYGPEISVQLPAAGAAAVTLLPLNASSKCTVVARLQSLLDKSEGGTGSYVFGISTAYGVFGVTDPESLSFNVAQTVTHGATSAAGIGYQDVITLTSSGCVASTAGQFIAVQVVRNKTTYPADTAGDSVGFVGMRIEDAHN